MQILPAIQSALPHNPGEKIQQVARQLEGQFAQLLIQSMRDASFGDALFPGENQLFHDLYDQQLANALTGGKGLGIAAMIERQLQPGSPAPLPPQTGTTMPAAAKAHTTTSGITNRAKAAGTAAIAGAANAVGASGLAVAAKAVAASGLSGAAKAVGTAVQQVAGHVSAHTPEQFVASIWQHAKNAAHELGVDARALIAQAALETGWGKHGIRHADGRSSHNLFGIKATNWTGGSASVTTKEYRAGVTHSERAAFRSYASPAESFADYVRLLKTSPRYRTALRAGGNVHAFARHLQQAGYATDPDYADKIHAIATGSTLKRALAAVK